MRHLSRLKAIPWYDLDRLARSRIALIGVGGIGSTLAVALAKSGCSTDGSLVLVDMDSVAGENLNRDFSSNEVGRAKVEGVRDRILSDIPDCKVEAVKGDVLLPSFQSRLEAIIKNAEIIIHATDDPGARRHINELSRRFRKPLLDVGASESQDQFHIHFVHPDEGPCCRCVELGCLSLSQAKREGDCSASFFPIVSGAACFAAYAVIAPILLGHGKKFAYLSIDLLSMRIDEVNFPVHPDCPDCRRNPDV